MNLSESTQQQIIEEFNLPFDIFKEMYIDEYVVQQKADTEIEKTIVLKHNSTKIAWERCTEEIDEDDDNGSWKN